MLLILSSNSFSQIDTNRICFSYNKAKSIALDLVKGDSAIAELKLANKLIWQLNEKSDAQDSLVTLYAAKEENYVGQIANYDQILLKQDEIITGLEGDVKTLTRKNDILKKGLKWLGGGFVASLLSVVTLVTIK